MSALVRWVNAWDKPRRWCTVMRGIRCHVIGNAGGPLSEASGDSGCITFNGGSPPIASSWHLDASSRRIPLSLASEIELKGQAPAEIVDALGSALLATTKQGSRELQCWPSTGFSIVHALWTAGAEVVVDRIRFDPSLCREGLHGPRSAPALAYHNWLGERRVTLARWFASSPPGWRWSLPQTIAPSPGHGAPATSIRTLLDAFERARSLRTLDDLTALAQVHIAADPALLTVGPEAATSFDLERCFHLTRGVSETGNWWLYDDEGARVAQALAAQVRQAQDVAFIQALNRRPASSRTTRVG